MSSLLLSDILAKTGLNLEKVKLLRHSLNDKEFKLCYDKGLIQEYTQLQKNRFSFGYDYWITFISDKGTSARLEGVYKVNGSRPAEEIEVADDHPQKDHYMQGNSFFALEKTKILDDMTGRLVIDWGKSTRTWHQKATTEKPVLAIQASPSIAFTGFQDLILSYQELSEIVHENILYSDWHTALSSIHAIYLITDTETGKQYIGSAYGKGGLLGRWSCYVNTKHGNDKLIKELICNYPQRYKSFQFSILQILPKDPSDGEVLRLESLYKNKLLTIKFGMNGN